MPRRRRRASSLTKAAQLSNARDRREFQRMGTEKLTAFWESMNAMGLEMAKAQQQYALFAMRQWWSPWVSPGSMAAPATKQAPKKAVRREAPRRGRRRSASTG
jgi:hypothetical protein